MKNIKKPAEVDEPTKEQFLKLMPTSGKFKRAKHVLSEANWPNCSDRAANLLESLYKEVRRYNTEIKRFYFRERLYWYQRSAAKAKSKVERFVDVELVETHKEKFAEQCVKWALNGPDRVGKPFDDRIDFTSTARNDYCPVFRTRREAVASVKNFVGSAEDYAVRYFKTENGGWVVEHWTPLSARIRWFLADLGQALGKLLVWVIGLLILGFFLSPVIQPHLVWICLGSGITAFLSNGDVDGKPKSKFRSFIHSFSTAIALISVVVLVLSILSKSNSGRDCYTEWDGRSNPTYCD